MSYKRSTARIDFEARIDALVRCSRLAASSKHLQGLMSPLRDMVLQCAILHTSAALETYLKLIVETWAQKVRTLGLGKNIPANSRVSIALSSLSGEFSKYLVFQDEERVTNSLSNQSLLWEFLAGNVDNPPMFQGKTLLKSASYPSYKNIIRLFKRIGIKDINHQLSIKLKGDPEIFIENFQSLRTALAHEHPPLITINDVRDRTADMKKLVAILDRLLWRHIVKNFGIICTP